jgi:hypothetical protein
MLYKEHIKKIINEVLNNSYGHWIGPDGTVIEVPYSHERTAIEVIKSLIARGKISQENYDELHIPLNSTAEVEDFLYEHGWIRGVREANGEYYVNGKRNQQLTPKQIKWLREYGEDNNRTVAFVPKGEGHMRGIKFIHHAGDTLEEDFRPVKPVTPEQEKMAKFFIFNVWRLMPVEDRFSPYQFSMWMDNEPHLQEMKARIARQIFPNDDEASYKFFDDIITPTLEKMEDKFYARKAKKIDPNDPLFILKSIVRGKSYRVAKNALYKATQNRAWQQRGPIDEDMVNALFQRQYRLFMGETMLDFKFVANTPYLSDLRQPSPTQSKTEEIFIQHYAGWKAEKFPDIVKVWRGTNSPHNKIRPGDFVTFDRDYAERYVTGKFGAIVKAILSSKDLKVYKMEPDSSEMVYWPHGHSIKKYTGHVPTFKEFWEEFR